MVHDCFIWSVQFVPLLPVHIRHPHLLPIVDIFEILAVVARIFQQMSMAEGIVRGRSRGFEWPYHLVLILFKLFRVPRWLTFLCPVLLMSHSVAFTKLHLFFAFTVVRIFREAWVRINCDHWILARIAAMQHLYHLFIPQFISTIVTIDLQLIGLVLIVMLEYVAGTEVARCLLVLYSYHLDSRCIWELWHVLDIFFNFSRQLLITLIPKVVLIVDDYAKSLRVRGPLDQSSQGMK